jgi:two-component system cell cycle sensor histidine kinase PleC
VVALFGIMQDITERTIYESRLREALAATERAYAAKSQFLANMSHELRTPLNAIIGFSEMMQRQLLGPIGTEKYLDYLTGIRESGEHLLDLISDILDMSKIEAGKYELDPEDLNIAKVIRLAVHMMEGRAQDARIRIVIDIDDENRHIVCDRRAFMQILLNVLSNAVKFTRPGGEVRIECRAREDGALIRIQDNGIGIPASKLANITNPFEQAASHFTRDHEGTGLGLSITKELVELHGGVLHIDSTVGVGTAVTIRLPLDARRKSRKKPQAATA